MLKKIFGLDPSFTGFGVSDGEEHRVFVAPKALEGEERATSTQRRSNALAEEVVRWMIDRTPGGIANGLGTLRPPPAIYLEAPMLAANAGSGHLYELGWLMSAIYRKLAVIGATNIIEVSSPQLRKFIGLPGNAAKNAVPVRILKRFGLEFDGDRGSDMAFAYLLHRYGLAVELGEAQHAPSIARGQGGKARASQAKIARSKAAVA